MKYLKYTIWLLLPFLFQCSASINFEEDFSGSWDIVLIDLVEGFDGSYRMGVGTECCDDCCGDGSAWIQIDGYENNYTTQGEVSGNGSVTIDYATIQGDRGVVSGKFNRDNTGQGTYSIEFTNWNTNESTTLTGEWTATRR